MISPASIENLLGQVRIEEVVGDYVNLKRRGVNFIGLCPFHNERTPSFTVSPAKGLFKCFGCGKGGSAVTFLMEHEHFTYPESIRHLAQKYRFELEETTDSQEEAENRQQKESLYIVTSFALDHFVTNLFDTDEGRSIGLSYFKERGFRDETIKKFHLGYALNKNDALTKAAKEHGFEEEWLKKAGVTSEAGRDFIFGRVIFPIHNLTGKPVAFAGRVLKKEIQPKYLNSPETDIYSKSKTLYGLYFARTAIRKYDECFMVEGYTDVISLHQAGIENVVASSGTALTVDHLKLIKRFTDNVTLLYDGDAAGIKATLRGMELALEQDINVRIVTLPETEDPDSFMQKKGVEGFTQYVKEHAENFIIYKTRYLLKDSANDPIRKAEAVRGIIDSIALMPDVLKRSIYIKECSRLMDVDEALLTKEVNKARQKQFSNAVKTTENVDQSPTFLEPTSSLTPAQPSAVTDYEQEKEFEVMKALIEHGHKQYNESITLAQHILSQLDEIPIDTALYNDIIAHYRTQLAAGLKPDYHDLINDPRPELQQLINDIIFTRYAINSDWEKHSIYIVTPDELFVHFADKALLYLKLVKMKKLHAQLLEKLKDAEEPEEQTKYLEMLQNLQGLSRIIRKELGNIIN